MLTLPRLSPDDPRPLYQQVAAAIRQQCASGKLQPGQSLPTLLDLGRQSAVNLHTIRQAYVLLAQEGILNLRRGRRAEVSADLHERQRRIQGPHLTLAADDLVVRAGLAGMTLAELQQFCTQRWAKQLGGSAAKAPAARSTTKAAAGKTAGKTTGKTAGKRRGPKR